MQRKNYILNHSKKSRNGMAMIMAIAVIVIIGTIMALSLSLTSLTTKRTTDLYLYEQAILLSKSATEYAILDISLNGCNNNINIQDPTDLYDINITMRYVYTALSSCNDYLTIATPEQNGSVLMDVTVSTDVGTEPITYFRRTIQKL